MLVHEHQVHRFFGVVGRGIIAAYDHPGRKGPAKEQLNGQDIPPGQINFTAAPHWLPPRAAQQNTDHRHRAQSQPDAAGFIAQQAITGAQPERKADEQNAQTFRKSIATIG